MPPTPPTPASSRALAAALALLFLGAMAAGGGRFAAERWLLTATAHAATPILAPTLLFTRLGNLPVLATIAIGIALGLGHWRGWRLGWSYAGSVAAGRIAVELVKLAVRRPRPLILPHLDAVGDWSFPSAHAAMATIAYLGAALLTGDRWLVRFALLVTGLIGASRVALGVHWPTDILAAWALGGLWAMGSARLLRPLARRKRDASSS